MRPALCTQLAVLAACSRSPAIERIAIDDPAAHWIDGGFAEMVPAIRLPTTLDGKARITSWLRVPEGGRLGVRRRRDGRTVLTYPDGTVADRVELRESATAPDGDHAWNVIDVRGTRLDGDAEQFHCLQPTDDGSLAGFAWARGDGAAERTAADRLVDLVAARPPGRETDARAARLERLRRLTHCEPCHIHGRRERTQISEGGPHRATDGAGFYSMFAVLGDEAPLEDHRPRDLNADDPFMTLTRADRGAVPRARLDFARALASGRDHERAVCRSRRYLFDHMDDDAREAFAHAFSECGIR